MSLNLLNSLACQVDNEEKLKVGELGTFKVRLNIGNDSSNNSNNDNNNCYYYMPVDAHLVIRKVQKDSASQR